MVLLPNEDTFGRRFMPVTEEIPGEYNLQILGTSANMSISTLTNTTFPIHTTRPIYSSPTAEITHFAMEIL